MLIGAYTAGMSSNHGVSGMNGTFGSDCLSPHRYSPDLPIAAGSSEQTQCVVLEDSLAW